MTLHKQILLIRRFFSDFLSFSMSKYLFSLLRTWEMTKLPTPSYPILQPFAFLRRDRDRTEERARFRPLRRRSTNRRRPPLAEHRWWVSSLHTSSSRRSRPPPPILHHAAHAACGGRQGWDPPGQPAASDGWTARGTINRVRERASDRPPAARAMSPAAPIRTCMPYTIYTKWLSHMPS